MNGLYSLEQQQHQNVSIFQVYLLGIRVTMVTDYLICISHVMVHDVRNIFQVSNDITNVDVSGQE